MSARFRRVPISDIKIPRKRRPLRPVSDLAASIDEIGLLNPITVTTKMRLVAGLHRLEACRSLGWTKIPATVVDLNRAHAELAQLDENLVRRELSVLQRAEHLARKKAIYEALYPETKRGVAGGRASGKSRRGAQRTTDRMSLVRHVAERIGVSERTVEREIQIATAIPQEVRDQLKGTPAANDKTGLLRLARLDERIQLAVAQRVADGDGLARALTHAVADDVEHRSRRMPRGKYDVIVVDPPWAYDEVEVPYPVMTVTEIAGLPVGDLAARNCVLWLWTTNGRMRDVYPILDAWGFNEQTILTWNKHKIMLGRYLRNRTEHCVLATRGKPKVRKGSHSTMLEAPAREHSRKPDEFYELVEGLCPGRKLDMFARESRKGWKTWGAERDKFDRAAG